MGKYLIASLYSLAAIALVGVAVVTDSLKRSESFASNPSHSRDRDAEIQSFIEASIEYGIFAPDQHHHAVLSSENSTNPANSSGFESVSFAKHLIDNVFKSKNENFTYDPESDHTKHLPKWIPVEIQNGWIFLVAALLVSMVATYFILGPERIKKKWDRWIVWYEHSEHVLVGLLYPQLPIHIASGVFSVVTPIFILRVLKVTAEIQ